MTVLKISLLVLVACVVATVNSAAVSPNSQKTPAIDTKRDSKEISPSAILPVSNDIFSPGKGLLNQLVNFVVGILQKLLCFDCNNAKPGSLGYLINSLLSCPCKGVPSKDEIGLLPLDLESILESILNFILGFRGRDSSDLDALLKEAIALLKQLIGSVSPPITCQTYAVSNVVS